MCPAQHCCRSLATLVARIMIINTTTTSGRRATRNTRIGSETRGGGTEHTCCWLAASSMQQAQTIATAWSTGRRRSMDTDTTQQVDVISKYWNTVDLPSIKVCINRHLLIRSDSDRPDRFLTLWSGSFCFAITSRHYSQIPPIYRGKSKSQLNVWISF